MQYNKNIFKENTILDTSYILNYVYDKTDD